MEKDTTTIIPCLTKFSMKRSCVCVCVALRTLDPRHSILKPYNPYAIETQTLNPKRWTTTQCNQATKKLAQ